MDCCQRYKVRNEEEKKDYLTRLNKISGQIEGVKKMINEDRYCDDVITQLQAIYSSCKSLAFLMLDNHMHTCMKEDILKGNNEAIDEVLKLCKRF